MLELSYCLNEPNVVSEEFDDEYVVLNLTFGVYYSFRDSGNLLWKTLLSGASPAAILRSIESGGNPNLDASRDFLQQVIDVELVRPAVAAEAAALPLDVSRRLATIDTAPAVEVFDDLADFLLADPIHDTDVDKGWPVVKTAAQ